MQPNDRRSGRRRYDEAAVALVGAILLLREVGFSLKEIRQIMRPATSASGSAAWRDVAVRKLKDLDDRIELRRLGVLSGTPSLTTMTTSSIAPDSGTP